MHNYKALKSAGKVSVQKVKVVDRPVDVDMGVKVEESHQEHQVDHGGPDRAVP